MTNYLCIPFTIADNNRNELRFEKQIFILDDVCAQISQKLVKVYFRQVHVVRSNRFDHEVAQDAFRFCCSRLVKPRDSWHIWRRILKS